MTPLQSACCACLLDGMSAKEAARAIGRSPKTIETTLATVRRKLNARSSTHLAAMLAAGVQEPRQERRRVLSQREVNAERFQPLFAAWRNTHVNG